MSSAEPNVSPALPWEARARLGPVAGYVETVKLFVSNPDAAWSATRESGGYEDPLLFAVASAAVGTLFSAIYRMLFFPFWIRLLPHVLRDRWEFFGAPRSAGCSLIVAPIVGAIVVTIGIFIASAIFHVCLMMVGGLNQSASGFEGTLRTVSYSSVSMLASVIPLVGGLIGLVWGFFLNVKGAVRMHRTTSGKAAAAMLIPLACLIILLLAALAIVVGMIIATRPSR